MDTCYTCCWGRKLWGSWWCHSFYIFGKYKMCTRRFSNKCHLFLFSFVLMHLAHLFLCSLGTLSSVPPSEPCCHVLSHMGVCFIQVLFSFLSQCCFIPVSLPPKSWFFPNVPCHVVTWQGPSSFTLFFMSFFHLSFQSLKLAWCQPLSTLFRLRNHVSLI